MNGVSGLRSVYSKPLWFLLATTGLVLLIACANLANLLLARASARGHEFAMRIAIGASRGRLVRQLLAESLLLAALGALAGAWFAPVVSRSIVALISTSDTPRFLDLTLDWRMLAFTGGLTVLTCVLCGIGPAFRATRTSPVAAMNAGAGSRGTTAGRESLGLRRALVVLQIALSLILLQGALLFGRTLQNLMTVNAGFQPEGILQVDFQHTVPPERRVAVAEQLLERVRAIPGVTAAATTNYVPLGGSSWNNTVVVDSASGPRKGVSNFDRVSPGFFRTMEITLLGGRDFDARDDASAPQVAIVNESFARVLFGGADPVGRSFQVEMDKGALPRFEIVGLVKDTKYGDLREEFSPIAFYPARQATAFGRGETLVVRSSLPAEALVTAVKGILHESDPDMAFQTTVFTARLRESLHLERLMAALSGFFGALASLIAAGGLFGVVSFMVAQRRNEIAIRMALGAHASGIAGMILREVAVLLVMGLGVGAIVAILAGRAATTLLFGLTPYDPATVALAMAAMSAVVLAASYVPALRAARLDPMIALRSE
jgi:predicted permease